MSVRKDQRGSSLIIALFILLVLAFFVGVLTLVLLNTIRGTTGFSLAKRSYYAAESGVEQGLYYLQLARVAKITGVQDTVGTISGLAVSEADAYNFNSDAEYSVTAAADNDYIDTSLIEGSSATLDFFDEDYTSGYKEIPIAGLSTIFIGWDEASSCATPNSSKIEVSFASWLPSYWQDLSDPVYQTKYAITCPAGSTFQCEYNGLGVDDQHIYTVKIKSLECDLDHVYIAAFDGSSNVLTTHNEVAITSTGTLGNTEQSVSVTTVWRTPLNDYFDYVLFSDEDLVK